MTRDHTYIIAEAGVNHNGSLNTALEMIDIAAEAGADAVKFQTFKTDCLVTPNAPKAHYQTISDRKAQTQYDMIKRLELRPEDHEELMARCKNQKIDFLSTPFDLDSIDLLQALGLNTYKIPSGEITNLPYLRKIGGLRKQIILSTGMSELSEIKDALSILEQSGSIRKDIILLHCNTEYPTPFHDVNLLAMKSLAEHFPGVGIGYSDHTLGIEIPIAAAALGAIVIEKHFTINRQMTGPDHAASLEPDELKAMVRSIRRIEMALGNGKKTVTPSEKKNIEVARKSIVAKHEIMVNDTFTPDNITVKRPGTGVSPMKWDEIIGTQSDRHYEIDELIQLHDSQYE